ncbi:MAG: ATP-binding protein [Candidatus Nanopelagicales bacterium]
MGVLLEGEDLDRVAPFGVLCDTSLVVTRTGPSWARLTTDFVGLPLLDVFDLVRPAGIDSVDGLRRHRDSMLLLRLKPRGPRLRFQVVDVSDPAGVMLVGTPVVSSSEELDRLGLSAADFSPIDQTPDLLLLRRGQERSLADLRTLNTELQRSSSELRRANKMLTRAEARYRRLVELQPLIMYIDTLGAVPTAEFMSAQAEAWLGYPVDRWMNEPGFFFDIVHPDDRDRVLEAHLHAERDDSPFDQEFRVRASDGHVMWLRAVDSVVRDDDDGSGQRIGFMLDITSAKTAELELQSTMSRLTTLLAHMQTGVLVEDAERKVVMANDMLCEVFGVGVKPGDLATLPASAALGQLIPGAAAADFLTRTDDLLHKRWPQPDQTLVLPDGRVLEFDFQPISSESRDLGALWMFRDATSRVQYQEALERAAAEALAASDAKTQFLASMSHEIRTPMHGVLATLDLLRLTPLDGEQRELVDVVNTSASSLIEIINDILDFERVEAGRIELMEEPFSPAEVLTGIVGLLRPQARAKGLEIGLVLGPDLPELVLGDALRLRQVVLNLAGNAVKFTATGGVTLTCTVVGRGAGTVALTFEVHDTGQGIAADRLGTIFDPFVQAKRSDEGTGLGLAISDRLVTLMGGQFQVSSTVGSGSTFRFTVELPEVSEVPSADGPGAAPEEPALPADSVLVVDDSDASRNLVLRQLSRLGVTARGAASGREALDLLETSRAFGLVLLDADMPELDGPATTELIRASQRRTIASVPVIALVVGDDPDWLARCRAARMDGHLSKPVDLAELRRVVDELLVGGAHR